MNSARPLRVLLMSGSMDAGGSEQQTCLLLNHLDRTQFDPMLYLTYRRGELLGRVPKDVKIAAFDDLEFAPRVNWPGRWHRRMVQHLRDVIRSNRIDVVYDRTFHMTLIAGDACNGRVGRVSTIVSPPSEDLPSTENRFTALKKQRLARAYQKSSQVIAVSDAVARSASEFYRLDRSKIVTLRSPVDAERLRNEAVKPSELPIPGQCISDQCLNVICVGRMTPEKGHATLLAAIRLLAEQCLQPNPSHTVNGGSVRIGENAGCSLHWVFWFVGDGPLRNSLEQAAREWDHLNDDSECKIEVRFTGRLASVAPLLSRCDLLVCPSHYEGMPNVVLEAMALGVPVIGSRIDAISEIVQHERTGRLFEPGNPSELASELMFFARNQDFVLEMANNAVAIIDNSFGVTSYVDRLAKYLQNAAAAAL